VSGVADAAVERTVQRTVPTREFSSTLGRCTGTVAVPGEGEAPPDLGDVAGTGGKKIPADPVNTGPGAGTVAESRSP
jgi:hypothetical protein